MAGVSTPIYPQLINNTPVTFVNADGTTAKSIYTSGVNGSKLEAIYATNTDSGSAYSVNIWIKQSGTSYLLGTVNVPLSAGNTTAAPTVNLLNSSNNLGTILNKDSNGNTYLYLSASSVVTLAPTGAVTSAKTLTFIAVCEDF